MTTSAPSPKLSPTVTSTRSRNDFWRSPGNFSISEALTETECRALAATQVTGRLGFFRDGVLNIFPVNYFVMTDHVYFRTSEDGMIATGPLEQAAFQVDRIDQQARSGWTILFNGAVTRMEDPDQLTELWGKAVDEPWAPGSRDLFLRLTPTLVRGRRIETAY